MYLRLMCLGNDQILCLQHTLIFQVILYDLDILGGQLILCKLRPHLFHGDLPEFGRVLLGKAYDLHPEFFGAAAVLKPSIPFIGVLIS